jgi:hypothetical protein
MVRSFFERILRIEVNSRYDRAAYHQSERVDDIPLLLAQLDRMHVARLPDECSPTHGNWDGLSLGQVVSVWLAFILSEANHRMNHVKPWAERRLPVLAACLDTEVRSYSSKLSCMILDLV